MLKLSLPFRLIAAPLAILLVAATPAPQADPRAAERVRADIEFLGSDLLEGRDTGSKGYEIAAAYVASQFRSIGLKPGGTDGGWYQQVPFRRASSEPDARASMVIGNEAFGLGERDFSVRPSLTRKVRSVDAPLVFAGHGTSEPRLGIDEYAGIDARGKIVVVLEGAPEGLPSEIEAHLDSHKLVTAAEKGAVGMIEIAGTGRGPDQGRLSYYRRPIVDWVDPTGKTVSRNARMEMVGAISRPIAERLFRAAGKSLSRTLSAAEKPGGVAGFALPARLRLDDRSTWEDFTSPNVIGIIPGSDPALSGEYVVMMGHLDHLGVKQDSKPGDDRIYNGAIDNAAGIATLLEAARKFMASGQPPRRSVMFAAVTAEERGLRGADFLAANPVVPAKSIVAVVNLDMPMLLYPFTDVVAFGGDHSTVAREIAEAAAAMGVKVSPDPMPDEAIFVRSDHYRFVTVGVPSILLMTGYANGGEKKWKEFFAKTYHKPGDNISQPILYDQGARYAELNYRIARELASDDIRPLWYQGDYFGDAFAPGQPRAAR